MPFRQLFIAAIFSAGLSACSPETPDTSLTPLYDPKDWGPTLDADALTRRDEDARAAEIWNGACDHTRVNDEPPFSIEDLSPVFSAARFGNLEALRCNIDKIPEDFLAEGGDAFMARQIASLAYSDYYTAYLRGLDVTAEMEALCEDWGWEVRPEVSEAAIRTKLADAVVLGFLTEEELEAAKARQAERPTCAQTLYASGIAPPGSE